MPRKRKNLVSRKFEIIQLADGSYSFVDHSPVEKDWRDGKPYSVWKKENDNSDNTIFNNCIRKLFRQYNEYESVINSTINSNEKSKLRIKRISIIKKYLVDLIKYRLYLTSAERSKFNLIPENKRLNTFTEDIDALHQYLDQKVLDLDKQFDEELLNKIFYQITYLLDNIKKDSELLNINYYSELVEELSYLNPQFVPYLTKEVKVF